MRPLTRVVICGTYHRDPRRMQDIFEELEAMGCRILAPISLNFISYDPPVVKTSTEDDMTVADLEQFHLRAIRDADFVLLHAPDGYVGLSTSFEIGYAAALRKPVFSFYQPVDEMLSARVLVVRSVYEAMRVIA